MKTPLDRRLRRLSLTSAQAARILGVPENTLAQWSWGRNPTPRWAMRFLALYAHQRHLQLLSVTEIARLLRGKRLFLFTDHGTERSHRKRIRVKSASKALAIEYPKLLQSFQLVAEDSEVALLRHAENGELVTSAIRIE